jgi:hypothetical protein
MTKEEIHKMIQYARGYPNPIVTTMILGILDAINERIDEQVASEVKMLDASSYRAIQQATNPDYDD